MLFPTLSFALFFILVFAVSWSLVGRAEPRKLFLLVASYYFYGYWDWRFCFLLAFASVTAWAAGLALAAAGSQSRRRLITGVASAVMLVVLGFFKYYNFFLDSLQDVLEAVGLSRDNLVMTIILPVGISFFTFQAISYVVDVHRRRLPARRSLVDIMFYISFFPQLVAGPIVQAADFLPQLDRRPVLARRAMIFGFVMCMMGLFKKMVVANYLAVDLVDPVFFDPTVRTSLELLVAVYGYAVQIYCDFSGYSDIAIGTAALLGYRFKPNFDQPYRSASLQEFWRRWHISLSRWLRDYLYISLGGSRGGALKTARNLFMTMLLGGLWHGAAWTFVLWGALHGAGLVVERIAGLASAPLKGWRRAVAIVVVFHFVCAGWILFRSPDLAAAGAYFAGLARLTTDAAGVSAFSLGLIVIAMAGQFTSPRAITRSVATLNAMPLGVAALLLCAAMLLIDWVAPQGTAPFIYFQF